MASKPFYVVVAAVGIAAASGAAWWYQNQPRSAARTAEAPTAPAAAPAARGPAAGAGGAGAAARPPAVEVAKVARVRLVDEAQAVGSLRSRQSVVLRPEVSGRIAQIHFRDGERVRRGQLLVQLDDELPRAQMQQSQAELSIVQANHRRNQELVAQGFISQRSVDESAAALQVAQAKVALAKAQADRLRIVAPFDGTTGIRNVHVGDYLKDGSDIVNIEDLDAILVDFRLPERYQTRVRPGQGAVVTVDAVPGQRFQARVQAIDPLVDANGRSVGVRGCIDNRAGQLRPGMFARVTAVFGEREDARVVPEEALVPQGGRQFVIRLVDGPDQDAKVAQRVEVKVGVRQPGRVEILEGLEAGDLVVVAGQQRVQRDGMPVRVVEVGRGGPGGPGGAAPENGASPRSANPAAAAAALGAAPGGGPAAGARKAAGPNPCQVVAAAAPARR
ncbi:efflux RND transporter periplasmic adaptor subunit [Ramlibacter rhizophilus]|uniref:Efflux RND transporter periplasmic adaptor subunit n=1 Tax=Ramlibacter rhizophilus TaxID=1781167 RepID=A0A4Z0BGU4_9BURK|nr:efflux RND transporter periplasmic adaptor subunit [Ramlibacter rhizophilus]TFY98536.1 efflux RND transporter periplasmic adaptor subunit [Ramlibacter rhizophilus]